MKKLALLAAAAATLALTIPASAQGVSVRIGEPGYHRQHHNHGMRSRSHMRGRDVVVVRKSRHGRHDHGVMRRPGRTVVIGR